MAMNTEKKEAKKVEISIQRAGSSTHHINVFAFPYDNEPRNAVARWKLREKSAVDGPKRNAERLRSIHKPLKTRHHL